MTTPVADWPTLRGHLLAVLTERGVTFGQLAKLTGLQRSTVNGAFTVNADTQWGTVARILGALELDLAWVQELSKPKRKPARKPK